MQFSKAEFSAGILHRIAIAGKKKSQITEENLEARREEGFAIATKPSGTK